MIQIIGIIGSILVAISLTMSNIKKLRIINLVGAATFCTYGMLIKAPPVFMLNGFIVCIDIYYLIRIYRTQDRFFVNYTFTGKEFFFNKFLEYFHNDIKKFFPEFDFNTIKNPQIILISRNMNPVGLFIYEQITDHLIDIKIDYIRPEYRDMKNADFLYRKELSKLKDQGIETMQMRSGVKQHQRYLKKLEFNEIAPNLFQKGI